MPYGFVEPELILDYKGVRIYRAYQDDDINHPWFDRFVRDIHQHDDEAFHITDYMGVPPYKKDYRLLSFHETINLLKIAIDNGKIKPY
jgi:hypothetical protein